MQKLEIALVGAFCLVPAIKSMFHEIFPYIILDSSLTFEQAVVLGASQYVVEQTATSGENSNEIKFILHRQLSRALSVQSTSTNVTTVLKRLQHFDVPSYACVSTSQLNRTQIVIQVRNTFMCILSQNWYEGLNIRVVVTSLNPNLLVLDDMNQVR